jgi:Protein of unknown function (DUF1588)/Protein of unknown function (DUF1592)/Protein of unknown function (DUF1595)/Protein of unknown function (DUF1585)/Protein of unknown function (DUF1587)
MPKKSSRVHVRAAVRSLLPAAVCCVLGGALATSCVDGAFMGPGQDPDDVGNNPPPPPPEPDPFAPAEARLRRLASWQIRNAIGDILGSDAAAVVTPPDDVPLNGFYSVGAASLSLSPIDVERVEQSAFWAAQAAVHGEATQSWRVCAPASFDDRGCMEQIVGAVGRRAFRRPLTSEQLTRFTDVGMGAATAYGDFDLGLEFAVAGLFQSPQFLYQVEIGVPLAGGTEGDPNARALDGYEIASRLSFFLLGTTPSDGLLDAAARGDLDDATGVGLYAESMLADPRAKAAVELYFDERLQLTQMLGMNRAIDGYTDDIQSFMREETLRFIGDIVWDRNADARELFFADFTYLNDPLASYYGLPLPGTGAQFARVTLDPSTSRGGLLTQGAFLSRFAHLDRSSPTLRGKFVREALMCQAIGAPPNDVDTTLPELSDDDTPRTTRQRIEQHMEEPRCASCHIGMDPIGFAFEAFDQGGRFRTTDNGLPVDSSGDLDGQVVDGARGLSSVLKEDATIPGCLVRNLFRHGVGHIEERSEDASLFLVESAFEDAGYRLRDLLFFIATSDAFRLVTPPGGAP